MYDGSEGQKWRMEEIENKNFIISSFHTDKVLSMTEKRGPVVWERHRGDNQIWRVEISNNKQFPFLTPDEFENFTVQVSLG